MSNLHKLKEVGHNWVIDGVTGNIGIAIERLLSDLKEEKKSNDQMLCSWDKTRGNDWFTETRKCLTEIDLDDE